MCVASREVELHERSSVPSYTHLATPRGRRRGAWPGKGRQPAPLPPTRRTRSRTAVGSGSCPCHWFWWGCRGGWGKGTGRGVCPCRARTPRRSRSAGAGGCVCVHTYGKPTADSHRHPHSDTKHSGPNVPACGFVVVPASLPPRAQQHPLPLPLLDLLCRRRCFWEHARARGGAEEDSGALLRIRCWQDDGAAAAADGGLDEDFVGGGCWHGGLQGIVGGVGGWIISDTGRPDPVGRSRRPQPRPWSSTPTPMQLKPTSQAKAFARTGERARPPCVRVRARDPVTRITSIDETEHCELVSGRCVGCKGRGL